MSRAKTERLLNLVICLLAARRYLSKDEIRRSVPGYSPSDEAFERAFERDKEELREMGVPVETGSNSVWFEDEVGYRIRRDAYALPEVSFSPGEMAVLGLAARAWQQATLAGAASTALLKLQAYGVARDDLDLDLDARMGFAGVDPRVDANEAAFLPLWQALSEHRPVRFDYRRPGDPAAQVRTVEPWGLVAWHGRWYLVGHDRERGDTRVFRLSRMQGEIASAGEPGEVVVPEGVDVRREVASFASGTAGAKARIRVRAGAGGFLRRQALQSAGEAEASKSAGEAEASKSAGGAAATIPTGWDVLEVPYSDPELLADAVAGLGSDAVVEAPAEVRDAVVRRLRGVLSGSETGG